jgi:hypothetical protein
MSISERVKLSNCQAEVKQCDKTCKKDTLRMSEQSETFYAPLSRFHTPGEADDDDLWDSCEVDALDG